MYLSETDLFDDEDDFYENMECLEHLTKLFQFLYDMYQLPPDYCSVVDDSEFWNQVTYISLSLFR